MACCASARPRLCRAGPGDTDGPGIGHGNFRQDLLKHPSQHPGAEWVGGASGTRGGTLIAVARPCLGLWVKLGVVRVADDEGGRGSLEWVLGDGSLISGTRSQGIKQGQES